MNGSGIRDIAIVLRVSPSTVIYEQHIEPALYKVGKGKTQKIERKPLTLRTRIKRLVRETICLSKSIVM